jgi:hypothetical protein
MKVIKRGLFFLAILVLGAGLTRSASAISVPADSDEFPTDGTYSFSAGGTDVVALLNVPASSMSGVFTVTGSTSTFAVSAGSFILNDKGNICTGKFSGTGTPVANTVTSGTMALTLSSLSGVCTILGTNGSPLTLYYSVASQSPIAFLSSPSHSVIFFEDIDTNTLAITGEAQLQASPD